MDRFVDSTLKFKRSKCEETIPVPELNLIQSLCKLIEALATPKNGVEMGEDPDAYSTVCKMWFLFWFVSSTIYFSLCLRHIPFFFINDDYFITEIY